MHNLHSHKSGGFSLVELMVSLALSSIMLVAVVSLFAGNSKSLRVQQALMDVNETGRYALDRMARDIRMLGFRAGDYDTPGALADALVATAGDSDTLTVIYEAPFDCNRVAAPPAGQIQNRFEIVDGNLRCNDQILVRGVQEMRILLGEDLVGDRVPNRFVLASEPTLDIDRVVSVSIRLLTRSQAVGDISSVPSTRYMWNSDIVADGHMHNEYTLTVALRNRI